MRYLLLSAIALATYHSTSAQNVGDALRYSRINSYGTARTTGAGGAFTALGADFGAISLNPAGLAMFRSDEFMFTPTFQSGTTDAKMDVPGSPKSDDTATRLRFSNVGVVFNTNRSNSTKWRNVNVALGYNQLNHFTQNTYYEGQANGTILNGWFKSASPFLAGGGNPDNLYPLGEGLAYNANAIYFQDNLPSYDFINTPDATTQRTHSVNTRGSQGEMTFAVAGNYMDRLMLGASVGMPTVRYTQDAIYTESDPGGGYEGNVAYFDNLTYTDYVRTNGIGFNAKLGATLRVNQMLRLGAAFHSPTFMNLTDNFDAGFEYAYQDQTTSGALADYSENANAAADPFNYGLRTPWRATFGGAILLNKLGFISADVDYTDYSAARFNLTKESNDAGTRAFERSLNAQIANELQPALNYRFGAEIVLDIFRLRAGYNLLGKARRDQEGFDNAFSLGAGIRQSHYYLDLAFRSRNAAGSVSPYASEDAPRGITDTRFNDVMLTIGFKF
jgi:hypothetical protein